MIGVGEADAAGTRGRAHHRVAFQRIRQTPAGAVICLKCLRLGSTSASQGRRSVGRLGIDWHPKIGVADNIWRTARRSRLGRDLGASPSPPEFSRHRLTVGQVSPHSAEVVAGLANTWLGRPNIEQFSRSNSPDIGRLHAQPSCSCANLYVRHWLGSLAG